MLARRHLASLSGGVPYLFSVEYVDTSTLSFPALTPLRWVCVRDLSPYFSLRHRSRQSPSSNALLSFPHIPIEQGLRFQLSFNCFLFCNFFSVFNFFFYLFCMCLPFRTIKVARLFTARFHTFFQAGKVN